MTAVLIDAWNYVDRDSDADDWSIVSAGHGAMASSFWQRVAEGKHRD